MSLEILFQLAQQFNVGLGLCKLAKIKTVFQKLIFKILRPGQVVQIGSPIDSPNWLKCQVPSQLAPGSYIVAISLDGGSTWTNENTVLYTYGNFIFN